MLSKISLLLVIIGAFNWGLLGLFGLDAVAWLLGGTSSIASRAVYTIIALAGVWCVTLLFTGRVDGTSQL